MNRRRKGSLSGNRPIMTYLHHRQGHRQARLALYQIYASGVRLGELHPPAPDRRSSSLPGSGPDRP